MRHRIRTGIWTNSGGLFGKYLGRFERCNKHRKVWREGEEFERFGGSACEECISKSRPTLYGKKGKQNHE